MGIDSVLRETMPKHDHTYRLLVQASTDIRRKFEDLDMGLNTPKTDILNSTSMI